MSVITVNRIAGIIQPEFQDLIDMADYDDRPTQRDHAFYQRGLAALCIKSICGATAEKAAAAITDGFHDEGIDAIHFNPDANIFLLVTSRWSRDGNKGIDDDTVNSFLIGVTKILSGKLDAFNDKIKAKQGEIKAAIEFSNASIVLACVSTSEQPMPPSAKRKVHEYVGALNNPSPLAEAVFWGQRESYDAATAHLKPPRILLEVSLKDWGFIDRPFLAYYGRAHTDEVAKWWADHGSKLCDRNLRHFTRKTQVNDAIGKTLQNDPANFWYFNNGITIICDTVEKRILGSPDRGVGVFSCNGASIVNGAQTVGMIGTIARGNGLVSNDNRSRQEQKDCWVQVRIISLQDCPAEFDKEITRATNLQNAVGYVDLSIGTAPSVVNTFSSFH